MRGIDLRSDTVTEPTSQMRIAMSQAEVGDDGLDGDPTTQKLEELAAELTGKEAGLLVASGSMGNLTAALSHVPVGNTMFIGQKSHMAWSVDQAHGHPTYGQIDVETLDEKDGTLPIEQIENLAKIKEDAGHKVSMISVENTHNQTNGLPIDLPYMASLYKSLNLMKVKLHVDGARLFNAAVALETPAYELVNLADSVSFCLSKGLACPIGSIVCGSKDFVSEARKQRKIVGGEMRQTGIIAAAGIVSLETMIDRLADDHDSAKYLATGLAEIEGVLINPEDIKTNIVFFESKTKPAVEIQNELEDANIHCFAFDNDVPHRKGHIRMVTHYQISKGDIDTTLLTLSNIMKNGGISG